MAFAEQGEQEPRAGQLRAIVSMLEVAESALSAALRERDEARAEVARWKEHYERETAEMAAGEDDLAALREAVELHRLACSGQTACGPCVLCLRPVFSTPSPSTQENDRE
jgi:hypothetical protein